MYYKIPKPAGETPFTLQSTRDSRLREKVEKVLGVRLGVQVIHHIDDNPCNNDLSNLAIMRDAADHHRWHRSLIYRRLVKLITVEQILEEELQCWRCLSDRSGRASDVPIAPITPMGGIAMLEDMNKLLDVLENMSAKVDMSEPKEVNELEAFVGRLEGLAMEIKDRIEP